MAARVIQVPSFEYAAFYYPQILEALLTRKRIDVPELTDESEFEPFIQLLRSFALVGHLNNTLLDVVANESTLPTAQLVESVRNMLKLIGYRMATAAPAATEIVFPLGRVFNAPFEIVPALSRMTTRAEGSEDVVHFEVIRPVTVSRTDLLSQVSVTTHMGIAGNFTSAANSGSTFTPWPAGPVPIAGDAIYFGHDSVLWDVLSVLVSTPMGAPTGVWEFYEGGAYGIQPTQVLNLGTGALRLDITSLLGPLPRQGARVRVSLNETGASEVVLTQWTGAANVALTAGLLGQTTPSEVASDYTVSSDWTEFARAPALDFVDGTAGLTTSGEVTFKLPQTEKANWQKHTINSVHAYWMRFRLITVPSPPTLVLGRCRHDLGGQYVVAAATQGRTVSDDPVGSSDGGPGQEFVTTRDNFIYGSEAVTVDDEPWIRVDDFLQSTPQDKHYTIELGNRDRATIKFGDGVSGRIPPLGQGNVSITYRFDAASNGNVGANTVTVDKTGLSYVKKIYNPRQAGGWVQAEGSTPESLERAKLVGPASLRAKSVALNGDDAVALATAFVAADGTRPFSRATYNEEAFGPKTLELIVVGSGGLIPSAEQLKELELYFNGDKYARPPVPGHYVANNRIYPVSFTPYVVNIAVTVDAPEQVTEEQIVNGVAQVLQPEALKEDGVTYEWDFGGRVAMSRLAHEVFKVDKRIKDVDVSGADLVLTRRQLPIAGTITVTRAE